VHLNEKCLYIKTNFIIIILLENSSRRFSAFILFVVCTIGNYDLIDD